MAGRKKAEEAAPEKTAAIDKKNTKQKQNIKKLETREKSHEETKAGYQAGMKLVKSLSSQIDKVEKQIQILSEGEDNE